MADACVLVSAKEQNISGDIGMAAMAARNATANNDMGKVQYMTEALMNVYAWMVHDIYQALNDGAMIARSIKVRASASVAFALHSTLAFCWVFLNLFPTQQLFAFACRSWRKRGSQESKQMKQSTR